MFIARELNTKKTVYHVISLKLFDLNKSLGFFKNIAHPSNGVNHFFFKVFIDLVS